MSLAPVAPGNFGMLPNAAVYPSDPQLPKSEAALALSLGQPDHCNLYTAKAFVKPAGMLEVLLAQRNSERNNNSSKLKDESKLQDARVLAIVDPFF